MRIINRVLMFAAGAGLLLAAGILRAQPAPAPTSTTKTVTPQATHKVMPNATHKVTPDATHKVGNTTAAPQAVTHNRR